jgi:hypothetical protein
MGEINAFKKICKGGNVPFHGKRVIRASFTTQFFKPNGYSETLVEIEQIKKDGHRESCYKINYVF